ncbi:energy transducer TonB [Microbulbifer pacificus]|uniref:energy transducer TonB n=1 Tax=Microbulbifer pacificus TaxID=407164 RepID=UPI000CF54AF1|nr:energy transducer TonB [Microbulbifer pacificus]
MKLRLTVMLIGSVALHAWLLWAMPAQELQAPSGAVALKLGPLKLAAVPVEAPSRETPAEPSPIEPPALANAPAAPTAVEKVAEKEPAKERGAAKEIAAKKSVPADPPLAPSSDRKAERHPDSEMAVDAVDVATAPRSAQQSVGEAPVLIERPAFASPPGAPVYPELARQRRQQGTVVVEVQLDHTGAQVVRRLLHSSGVDSLDEAALKAVAGWKFLPYREGARARHSRVRLPIRFSL